MKDLIDREETIKSIYHQLSVKNEKYLLPSERSIVNCIKAQPAEKSEEEAEWWKPTGMMPPEHHGHWECSACEAWALKDWMRNRILLTRYCPGCGRRMRVSGPLGVGVEDRTKDPEK